MQRFRFSFIAFALRGVTSGALRGCSTLVDADEEERLAQLLVQDGSAPPGEFPTFSLFSERKGTLMQAIAADEKISIGTSSVLDAEAPLMNVPVTSSRRGNDHLAKYALVRQQLHTQHLADGTLVEPAREWMCMGCRTYNFVGRKNCRRCKQRDTESFKHHYPPARHTPLFPALWICHGCGHSNQSGGKSAHTREKFFCGGCGERFHGVREWYCPSCNHINSRASIQCATCLAARPNEWTCSACKHDKNSVFFTECSRCHVARRKLVSDSTVLCFSCQQRNDVQWEMCFTCMAPLGLMSTVRKTVNRSDSKEPTDDSDDPTVSALPNGREEIKEGDVRKESDAPKAIDQAIDTVKENASQKISDEIKESNVPTESDAIETPMECSDPSLTDSPSAVETEEGAWWCAECEVLQRRNAVFCDICLHPKTSAAPRPPTSSSSSSPSLLPSTTGEWRCPYCRRLAPATAASCCGEAREVPGGYWHCATCCSVNRDARSRCLGCAAPPPATPWRCFACRHRNRAELLECARCAGPHPHHWQCAACGSRCQHATDRRCASCAAEKPPSAAVVCGFCTARNNPALRACHRCRARLTSDLWSCTKCGSAGNARHARRCASCGEPRVFNPKEELWLCDVCDTAITSGGDLPVHEHCPRCGAARTERNLFMPSRWCCRSCGVSNPCAAVACGECGGKRRLVGLKSACSCPSCFRFTSLDERERCESCGGDLARVVSEVGSPISLGDLPEDEIFGAREGAKNNEMEATSDESGVRMSSLGKLAESTFSRNEDSVTLGKADENNLENVDTFAKVYWDNEVVRSSKASPNMKYDEGVDDLESEEEEIGGNAWDDDIPSWLCANCETTNLDEADICISCDLPRGSD